jgi:hypothetical protein
MAAHNSLMHRPCAPSPIQGLGQEISSPPRPRSWPVHPKWSDDHPSFLSEQKLWCSPLPSWLSTPRKIEQNGQVVSEGGGQVMAWWRWAPSAVRAPIDGWMRRRRAASLWSLTTCTLLQVGDQWRPNKIERALMVARFLPTRRHWPLLHARPWLFMAVTEVMRTMTWFFGQQRASTCVVSGSKHGWRSWSRGADPWWVPVTLAFSIRSSHSTLYPGLDP